MLELGQRLVIEGHLIAAHRAPVGRVEGKHNRFAGEIAERERLIRSDVEREVGRFRARREQLRVLPWPFCHISSSYLPCSRFTKEMA
jgi:hypothetical protein